MIDNGGKLKAICCLPKNCNHKMFKSILCYLNYIVLTVLGKKHYLIIALKQYHL